MKRSKIIAVDFDHTLFQIGNWPVIKAPNLDVINAAKKEQENGAKLILWTCRCGQELEDAMEVCAKYGLYFNAVNENIKEIQDMWGDSRKVVADEYWDDRNFILQDVINRWKEED